ncbi:MAG: hypothetical protein AB1782_17635 [Cyanobacteriota bacterium]
MENNQEETLFCPHCRSQIDDLEATSCPKCWGTLDEIKELEVGFDIKTQIETTLEEPTEEKYEEPKPEIPVEPKIELSETKYELINTIVLATIAILMLVNLIFVYDVKTSTTKIKKDITKIQQEINHKK